MNHTNNKQEKKCCYACGELHLYQKICADCPCHSKEEKSVCNLGSCKCMDIDGMCPNHHCSRDHWTVTPPFVSKDDSDDHLPDVSKTIPQVENTEWEAQLKNLKVIAQRFNPKESLYGKENVAELQTIINFISSLLFTVRQSERERIIKILDGIVGPRILKEINNINNN